MSFALPLTPRNSDEFIWDTVSVAAVSAISPIGEYEKTAARYAEAIATLPDDVKLVVTPEIALGYQRERAYHQPRTFEREFALMMKHIAPLSGDDRLILWGLPVYVSGCPYNAVAYLFNGECVAIGAKTKLAQGGEYEDSRYFNALEPGFVSELRIGDSSKVIPFGDLVVDIGGTRIKALICEDLWFEGGPAAKVAEEGVDIIAWLNTSHDQVGKHFDRVKIIDATSMRTSTAIVAANALGVQGGHHVFGGGQLISVAGKLVAASKRFSYKPWSIQCASVDVGQLRNLKLSNHSHRSHTPKAEVIFRAGSLFSGVLPTEPIDELNYLSAINEDKVAAEIVAFWIWQQFLLGRQQGMLVLNSGGSDSRMHLLLIIYALSNAINELGVEGFRKQLSHIKGIDGINDLSDFAARHVYGPYLRGDTSGEQTEEGAKRLCDVLGIRWGVESIEALEGELNAQTAKLVGLENGLSWENPDVETDYRLDITLQNAPARLRGIIGWQIANALGFHYFGTSNLDEVWSKYFTLSGDDSAACSGLAGVGKLRIKRVQKLVAQLLGIWVSLREMVESSVATAELRPAKLAQTDDVDCGKFEYRTMCRELIIGQDKTALQAFFAICHRYADSEVSADQQIELIEDVAFAVVKFTQPALRMHWARMQLALSPVVESGNQHAGTEESNRRAAVDARYIVWIEDLVDYIQANLPEAIPGLLQRLPSIKSMLEN